MDRKLLRAYVPRGTAAISPTAARLPSRGAVEPAPEAELALPTQRPRRSILLREARYRRALAAADLVAAFAAIVLALEVLGDDTIASPFLLLAAPVLIVVAKLVGLYDRDRDLIAKSTLDEAPTLFHLSMLYTLALTVGAGFVGGYIGPEQTIALLSLLFTFLLLMRALARSAVLLATPPERCLIVADPGMGDRVASKLRQSRYVAIEVVGRMDPADISRSDDERPSETRLSRLIEELDVHRVILAPSSEGSELDDVRLVKSLGVRVSLVPSLFEVVGSSVHFDHVDGLTLMGIPEFGLSRSSQLLKRAFDLALAGLGLLITAPLFAAIAIAIKLETPGPVLFRQPRVGCGGRHFEMLKFRSMVADAEQHKQNLLELNEAGAGLFKIANDPRITRIGVLIRRLSLDELPQLINVVKGDMSLVGPRPLVPEDDRHVEGLDRRRLAVMPGMTGIWQVLGSSRVPMREMVKLDYIYAANWSLWLDVKLLIRTVPLLLRSRNI